MVRNPSPVLQAHFADLEDPRVERTRLHNLLDIVFIALCAVVSGANDFVGMAKFGRSKQDWLRKFLELPGGIPSHDTFNRVLSALAPASFLDCFLSWVEALQVNTAGRIVGIDGKTVRASLDRAKGQNPLHVVSAWAVQNRLVLGQEVVDEKSNEITAIPKLLEVLELTGAIVTIDAMGCQKEIAAKVREKGADYVLAVKGNQERLEEDVAAAFAAVDDGLWVPKTSSAGRINTTMAGRDVWERAYATRVQRCCNRRPGGCPLPGWRAGVARAGGRSSWRTRWACGDKHSFGP
jgi:hypothetical protein